MLTVGSLFSGIGGIELGLERAGMRTVWQVEKDDYCRRVLAKHWPGAQRFDDVRTVGAHNLSFVDVICGGFPCQDISYAGKGAGLAGERSGLWDEFARIIRELGPRYVLVENVSALLGRGLGDVLGTLASFGYDAEWECIQAASVGAPHLRDRTFIVAYPQCGESSERFDADVLGRREREAAGDSCPTIPNADRQRELQPEGGFTDEWRRPGDGNWWTTKPDVGRVAYGVPAALDRNSALGNAVVPQVAEYIGRLIVAHAVSSPTRG